MLLGVDVGGTFTDAVLADGTGVHTAKAPTTPGHETDGVMTAIKAVLEVAGVDASAVERFVHGMTVGTNALLEERGARTALITTAGFEDVIEIGRQDRPSLYDLCAAKPEPLARREDRIGAAERIGPGGVVTPLSEDETQRVAAAVAESAAESAAICLLFSYLDPSHERALADAIHELEPGIHISASSDVLPRFREYERTSTTTIDAYLSPLIASYLESLASAADEAGVPEPEVMRSSGGISSWSEASKQGAWTVLSGPAGGAVGAGLIAERSGNGNAIGLDMGGTSCDVCVVEKGRVRLTESREIAGRVIQLPMVDVHTVGAGGGSIGWLDHGGAMRAGPRSAGADPGPACYGRGGNEPTVTDANLLLGRLGAGSSLAGGVELDEDLAREAVERLASDAGLGGIETAEGIVRLANSEMLRALRVVTVDRGVDPRDFALLPFGGAGPMHAADLAEEIGITRILCPRAGGVLSALGLVASAPRRDTARTVMLKLAELDAESLRSHAESVRETIEMADAETSVTYELRYEGQSFELPIPGELGADPAALAEDFADEHERRYGFRVEETPLELVAIGVTVAREATPPDPRAADGDQLERGSRRVHLRGEWTEAEVLSGEPPEGAEAEGPVVFDMPESTFVLPPGWSARVDAHGTIVAERG